MSEPEASVAVVPVDGSERGREHPARRWLKRLVPYAVAALAITAIIRKYPPEQIAAEMGRGNVLAMVPYAIPILLVSVSVLGYTDTLIFRHCVQGIARQGADRPLSSPTWGKLVRARMAMAPLALIGYTAGVGGYGLWLARVTGAGVGYTSGMVLYTLSSDLVAVSLVASLSIWVGGAEVADGLRYGAPAVALVLGALKLVQPRRLVSEDRLPNVFRPWRFVPVRLAFFQLAIRTANIYWIALFLWGGANAFGMPVPLRAMTTYLPIVLVVGSMPVNVAGFGAVQGAWLLLAPWADSGEQVLAFSVLWQLIFGAGLVLRGLPFLRGVVGDIDRGADREIALSAEG